MCLKSRISHLYRVEILVQFFLLSTVYLVPGLILPTFRSACPTISYRINDLDHTNRPIPQYPNIMLSVHCPCIASNHFFPCCTTLFLSLKLNSLSLQNHCSKGRTTSKLLYVKFNNPNEDSSRLK